MDNRYSGIEVTQQYRKDADSVGYVVGIAGKAPDHAQALAQVQDRLISLQAMIIALEKDLSGASDCDGPTVDNVTKLKMPLVPMLKGFPADATKSINIMVSAVERIRNELRLD
jgi:hypothetical protein